MKQEAIDRKVEELKEFGSFQDMAREILRTEMRYAESRAVATFLDELATLLRDGGEKGEGELYAEYQDEMKRIKERYHG